MRVLWLCNVALPLITKELNLESSNKEGWISGLADVILSNQQENNIELSIAFPAPAGMIPVNHDVCRRVITMENNVTVTCYGFYEDTSRAEYYDKGLEARMKKIVDAANPYLVHCFGTEYPHTLAMCRVFPRKDRILVGLQGLITMLAQAYYANLPEKVINSVTLRDRLRKDYLKQQQEKFARRGVMEQEVIKLVENITGRTEWDREISRVWNPQANYYNMNEILRPEFYGPEWSPQKAVPHSIFISQGDYPLKGLHYMLMAMPAILAKYPDAKVYVAGNSIVQYGTLKQKLKISAYGKYLRKLMKDNQLGRRVIFLGKLNAAQMRDQYLKSSVFVCCSSLENSPNSLGEAMILGVPCVSADVGGIPSVFNDGEDGILFKGFRQPKNNNNLEAYNEKELKDISGNLASAVLEIWGNPKKTAEYCRNAHNHAKRTHWRSRNYQKLMEIYAKIMQLEL